MIQSIGRFLVYAIVTIMAVTVMALPSKPAMALGFVYRTSMPATCTPGGELLVNVVIYKSANHTDAEVDMSSFLRIEDASSGTFLFGGPMLPNPNLAKADPDPSVDVITRVGKSILCDDLGASALILSATIILRDDPYDPELELRPSCNLSEHYFSNPALDRNPIKACQLAYWTCEKEFVEGDDGLARCKILVDMNANTDSSQFSDLNVDPQ